MGGPRVRGGVLVEFQPCVRTTLVFHFVSSQPFLAKLELSHLTIAQRSILTSNQVIYKVVLFSAFNLENEHTSIFIFSSVTRFVYANKFDKSEPRLFVSA